MYHFALLTDQGIYLETVDLVPMVDVDDQKTSTLKTSHCVSMSLLLGKKQLFPLNQSLTLIQADVAYLTFQSCSHSNLYEDAGAGIHSREYTK